MITRFPWFLQTKQQQLAVERDFPRELIDWRNAHEEFMEIRRNQGNTPQELHNVWQNMSNKFSILKQLACPEDAGIYK